MSLTRLLIWSRSSRRLVTSAPALSAELIARLQAVDLRPQPAVLFGDAGLLALDADDGVDEQFDLLFEPVDRFEPAVVVALPSDFVPSVPSAPFCGLSLHCL